MSLSCSLATRHVHTQYSADYPGPKHPIIRSFRLSLICNYIFLNYSQYCLILSATRLIATTTSWYTRKIKYKISQQKNQIKITDILMKWLYERMFSIFYIYVLQCEYVCFYVQICTEYSSVHSSWSTVSLKMMNESCPTLYKFLFCLHRWW
jgi:hypothetical protein